MSAERSTPSVPDFADYVRLLEIDLDNCGQEIHRLRETITDLEQDRDEGWRQHNQAEIGRLNAEARLSRAIATLEYMGGAEIVVDDLRHGALPEPSDAEDMAWEKRSRER